MRQIMRSSLDYAGFAQLCGRSPIMREIMRAHNRIIPRSLTVGIRTDCCHVYGIIASFCAPKLQRFLTALLVLSAYIRAPVVRNSVHVHVYHVSDSARSSVEASS